MEQMRYYPVTIYMNEEFVEEYFEPFLQLAKADINLGVNKIDEKKENIISSMSPYIRALIKKYVDFKKKKILEKKEE